ncbi:hypothetical protein NA57DRAFT_82042 [Rhizodiscina lignyota]|uniref:Uncharacterized protein n=1 Tax=Rhizodiscina lignyota TaxID=1504668 RepID=A0A9P4I478_9PEZI|nr:hypothetical protein NA57DRAFT_82042 [Rhizodiscina lignyota]
MQNLSFVNRSGPEAFKRDAESRKLVRSHVMREFRRKERTGAYKAESASSRSASSRGPSRSPAPSDSKAKLQNSPKRCSGRRPDDFISSFGFPELSDIDGTHVWDPLMVAPEANPLIIPDDIPNCEQLLCPFEQYPQYQKDYEQAIDEIHSIPGPTTLQPSAGLTAIRNNFYSAVKPFTTPSVFEMLLKAHGQFLELLTYHVSPDLAVSPITEYCLTGLHGDGSEMQITLFTDWLFFTSYMKGRYCQPHQFHFRCKQQVLKRINVRLQEKNEAVKFDTLGGVAGLICVENGFNRNSAELRIHLRGLRHLAEMVGQESLEKGRYRPIVLFQDFMAAICTSTRPLLTEVPAVPILRRHFPSDMDMPVHPCSPLLFCKSPIARNIESPILKTAVEEAFYALETLYFHSHAPHTLLLVTFGDRAISKLQRLHRDMENSDVVVRIGQACRLAAMIHIRACSRLIPHKDPRNREDVDALYDIMSTLDIHDWKQIPYILLWVLLTGSAAGEVPGTRCLFLAELNRLGLSLGIYWFDHFEAIVRNFLWLQAMTRGDVDMTEAPTIETKQ